MNDATSREAAAEAVSVSDLSLLASDVAECYKDLDELASYLLACRLFNVRVGEPPNAAQRGVLMQQVRRDYVDGRPWKVNHDRPAPERFDTLDVAAFVTASDREREDELFNLYVQYERQFQPIRPATERTARAEHAAERMDGLTIAEAADQSGHSQRAIRARVDRGTLRAWKGPDGKRRIPRADLIHAGLLDDAEAPSSSQQGSGSGSGSAAREAGPDFVPTADLSGFAMALWEKTEQAVREATEHRLLTQYAETRLAEAEAAAKRLEDELHEARAEAAVARHEAEQLRQRLNAAQPAAPETPAPEEDSAPRRRWWQRGS